MRRREGQLILSGIAVHGALSGLLLGVGLFAALGCNSSTGNSEVEDGDSADLLGEYRLASGPLEEIRFERDTRGRIVVTGFVYFPEKTRLSIRLLDSAEQQLGLTQVEIVNSLFRSLPLGPQSGLEPGNYVVEVTATFSMGSQDESVLSESKNGTALTGDGMKTTMQGDVAFEKRFSVTI